MNDYRALRMYRDGDATRLSLERLSMPEPADGEVLLAVEYSSVNYKDALAGTGRVGIVKRFPLVGGIDAAGHVARSRHPAFQPGDAVIATGHGLGVDHDGGYAEVLCLPGDWLQPLPVGLEPRGAALLGTAGFTAALALHRLLVNGQRPELGPILVTGASGGVGSIAVAMLARLGFETVAVSGKLEWHDWLRALGASQVLTREALPGGTRPLESGIWGGAIDSVGGDMLAHILASVVPNGQVASVGLAGGTALHTTVLPFILRGVGLLGCDSVAVPNPLRAQLWQRLASDWSPGDTERFVDACVGLEALPATFERLLAGAHHGRILVHPRQ